MPLCVKRASRGILKVGSWATTRWDLPTTSVVGKLCTSSFSNSLCVSWLYSRETKKSSSWSLGREDLYRFTAALMLSTIAVACFWVFTPSFCSILSTRRTDTTTE